MALNNALITKSQLQFDRKVCFFSFRFILTGEYASHLTSLNSTKADPMGGTVFRLKIECFVHIEQLQRYLLRIVVLLLLQYN